MIVYPPIFYGAELKLTFKGRLTWKVADTLQYRTTRSTDLDTLLDNLRDETKVKRTPCMLCQVPDFSHSLYGQPFWKNGTMLRQMHGLP